MSPGSPRQQTHTHHHHPPPRRALHRGGAGIPARDALKPLRARKLFSEQQVCNPWVVLSPVRLPFPPPPPPADPRGAAARRAVAEAERRGRLPASPLAAPAPLGGGHDTRDGTRHTDGRDRRQAVVRRAGGSAAALRAPFPRPVVPPPRQTRGGGGGSTPRGDVTRYLGGEGVRRARLCTAVGSPPLSPAGLTCPYTWMGSGVRGAVRRLRGDSAGAGGGARSSRAEWPPAAGSSGGSSSSRSGRRRRGRGTARRAPPLLGVAMFVPPGPSRAERSRAERSRRAAARRECVTGSGAARRPHPAPAARSPRGMLGAPPSRRPGERPFAALRRALGMPRKEDGRKLA